MFENQSLSTIIKPILLRCLSDDSDIEVLSFATSDGFSVCSVSSKDYVFEEDKLSAAASTLHSVSGAVSQQILGKRFSFAFLETLSGNVGFVSVSINGQDFVLTMSASESMNIAKLRIVLKRLSNDIFELF